MNLIRFEVRGIPKTQGSMRAFMPKGARFPVVTHKNPKTTEWRNLIAMSARPFAPETPWTGPVTLRVVFRLQRPQGHYGKHGVRASAPIHPAGSREDLDKHLRSLLDSLTGVIYRDDGQVIEVVARKEWGNAGAVVELRHLVQEQETMKGIQ